MFFLEAYLNVSVKISATSEFLTSCMKKKKTLICYDTHSEFSEIA